MSIGNYASLGYTKKKAQRLAKKDKKEYFIYPSGRGYAIMGKQRLCCLGCWYHVYPNGDVIQRGS